MQKRNSKTLIPYKYLKKFFNLRSVSIVKKNRLVLNNFVGCKSFLESNSPDILALLETNLEVSIAWLYPK